MLFILNFKTWRGGVGLAGTSAAAYAARGSSLDPTNDPEFFCTTVDFFLAGLTPSMFSSSSSSPESLSYSFLSLAIYSSY